MKSLIQLKNSNSAVIVGLIAAAFLSSCASSSGPKKLWIAKPVTAGEPSVTTDDLKNGQLPPHIAHGTSSIAVRDLRKDGVGAPVQIPAATEADQVLGKSPKYSYFLGLEKAERLYLENKAAHALSIVAELAKEYPKQERIFRVQGTIYRSIGEKSLALASYRKAFAILPSPKLENEILKLENETGAM